MLPLATSLIAAALLAETGEPDELERAFDAPKAAVAAPDHNVLPIADPPDPQAAPRARFEALAAAWDGGAPLDELRQISTTLGPPEQARVHRFAYELARSSNDSPSARRAAESWLLACGPTNVDACRTQALAALSEVAPAAAKDITRADLCLAEAETATASVPCLDKATALYRKTKDALMHARALLATASEEAHLDRAEATCHEPRCLYLRRRALLQKTDLLLAAGKPEPAARAALAEMRLLAGSVPPARRPYTRTDAVERACAAYDAAAGKDSCRKLEKTLHGELTFRDFTQELLGEGLPQEKIAQVNEHYRPLLEDCVRSESQRVTAPGRSTYRLRWMVLNDGRVDAVHVEGSARDDSPFAHCLRAQFARWRYPLYSGEWQHVEQTFTLDRR